MKVLLVLASLLSPFTALASSEIAARIRTEYKQLRALVASWEPEYVVGGYMNGKDFGDHEILWRLGEEEGDAEVIRIYRDKGEGKESFSVTFHFGDHMIDGHTIIRRFIGPSFRGWRNDSVDAVTGEYLGSQGIDRPALDRRDREILRKWKIKLPY